MLEHFHLRPSRHLDWNFSNYNVIENLQVDLKSENPGLKSWLAFLNLSLLISKMVIIAHKSKNVPSDYYVLGTLLGAL